MGRAFSISWKDAKSGKRVAAIFALLATLTTLAARPVLVEMSEEMGRMLSVIVRSDPGQGAAVEELVRDSGGTVGRRLGVINGFSAQVPEKELIRLKASPVVHSVTPNSSVRLQQTAEEPSTLTESLRAKPTDGFDTKSGVSLADMGKTYTVTSSDNQYLDIEPGQSLTLRYDAGLPTGATVGSVKAIFEHYEELLFAGGIEVQVGFGTMQAPEILGTRSLPVRLTDGNHTMDLTGLAVERDQVNKLRIVVRNNGTTGKKVRLDRLFVDVTFTAYPGSMLNTTKVTKAREVWDMGHTGSGVDVALVDSGVLPVNGLRAQGKVLNGADLSFEGSHENVRYLDTYGHGTHMAGIIAGRDDEVVAGNEAADTESFQGVAPNARVVNVKVAGGSGATDVSQVIAGIDWVIRHRNGDGMNIRVMNLSFGTDGIQSYVLDPLTYAVEQAWHKGIVVVVSAGNEGFGSAKMNNPAYDPYVIAVGANDPKTTYDVADDTVPSWSSSGDGLRNPDVVAPGKSIVGLRAEGSHIDMAHPEGLVADRFFRGSGTSQAAAVVSGAAALLLSQRPSLTPDQVKALLVRTARALPAADPIAQGNGAINIKGAAKLSTPGASAVQTHPRATGAGSLEASRGTGHLTDEDGVELRGEVDAWGNDFDGIRWSQALAADQDYWEGIRWSESDWQGIRWSGIRWSGIRWSGIRWSSEQWDGIRWSGIRWSGIRWSSDGWNGIRWSGIRWSSEGFDGIRWSGIRWSGTDWGD